MVDVVEIRLREFLKSNAFKPGDSLNGGSVVKAGGLIFIAATADVKFRAISKRTGKILFETDLPATGASTPAVYFVNGKEYVVIACGGYKWGGKKSDAYVAFFLLKH